MPQIQLVEKFDQLDFVNMLLNDAVEVDAAIANGMAKIYATPEKLFENWENEE